MNTNRIPHARRGEQGAALLVSLGVLVVVGTLAATLATLVGGNVESGIVQQTGNQAFFMAESGARYAIAQIRRDGMDAVDALDGKTFELGNGWGFQLAVQGEDLATHLRFRIDSTGFVSSGSEGSKQQLNGYRVDIPKEGGSNSDSPTSFSFAMAVLGGGTASITGSSYIDSYDSSVGSWNYKGQYRKALVYSPAPGDILNLGWSTHVYGSILVPEGTDVSDPSLFVNRPENVFGEPKIVTGSMPSLAPMAAPAEPAEIAKPVSWNPLPGFNTYGTQSIPGGNYATAANLSLGSASLTVTSNLALDVGRDIDIASSAGLTVNGNLDAWIARDLKVGGGGIGMVVRGDADFLVGRNMQITAQTIQVDGNLDLDVAGALNISGSGTLHVKGNACIDAGGAFSITNGGRLIVDGKVIIRARNGFTAGGGADALTINSNAAMQVYVDAGTITLDSIRVNMDNVPAQFLVFGSSQVTSVSVTGSAQVAGAIHAPNATLSLSGSSHIFGAVVAQSVTSFGGDVAIHYDEALARLTRNYTIPELPLRRYWIAVGD